MTTKQRKLLDYLKESIDFSDYNRDWVIYFNTVNNLLATYEEEVGWHMSIKERLLWLPSCLLIAFSYYDISKVLADCGYKESTDQEYQEKYYWENLAKFIAMGEEADKILSLTK